MGVITLTLIIAGWQSSADADPQTWVILACGITIALGTYMGGWRIIRTLGKGPTDVKPAQGFSAESSTAATTLASSAPGFALSTTQVASGSVIGSGLGRRGSSVLWRTADRIMVGWLFTLPAAGAVGGAMAFMVAWLGGCGILIDVTFAVVVILTIFLLTRGNAVTAANAMSEVAESGTVRPGLPRRTAGRSGGGRLLLAGFAAVGPGREGSGRRPRRVHRCDHRDHHQGRDRAAKAAAKSSRKSPLTASERQVAVIAAYLCFGRVHPRWSAASC